jgi:hypothetical protein
VCSFFDLELLVPVALTFVKGLLLIKIYE